MKKLTKPVCKDCKYIGKFAGDTCYHPSIEPRVYFDPIEGESIYRGMSAVAARKLGPCGLEGKLFEKAGWLRRMWVASVISSDY